MIALVLLFVLVLAAPSHGKSQIMVREIGLLRSEDDALLSRWSRVVRIEDKYIVAPLLGGGIAAFDQNGRHLWSKARDVVSDDWNVEVAALADTAVVFDPREETMAVVDLTGELRRVAHVPRASSYLMHPSGRPVMTYNDRSPDRIGNPLHILGKHGMVRSFGFDNAPVVLSQDPNRLEWKLARGSGETFWTHYRDRFRLEEWTIDGRRTGRRVDRDRPWFGSDPSAFPRSWLHAAHWDVATGSLFIVGHAPAPTASLTTVPRGMPSLAEEREIMDSILEIWLPGGERPVASTRIDPLLMGWATAGVAFSTIAEQDGRFSIQLWGITTPE